MPRERGFTLVEMMIVLAILSLAVALTLPYVARGLPGASLGAATQEVRAALAAARSAAIAQDRDVSFAGGTGAYRIDGVRHAIAPIPALAIEVSGGGIIFYPSGASSGGRIVIRDAARHRDLEVEALTGHAVLLP